jgi:putative nucleotidyltransferase with HDIG domain
VIETVTALTDDINCSLTSLEAAIKSDPACVARLLQMANSAFYGSGAPRMVTSVRRAILMFGFNAVKDITLSLTVFDCFRTNNATEIAAVNTLRLHSLAVATLSQYIAETCPRDIDEELAFGAGLLHDFGRVVLLHFFPQEYYQMLTRLEQAPEADISKIELNTFGVTHAVAGQWLGELWRFPPPMLHVIATHHSTHVANPLVAAVMLANALAHMHGVGFGGMTRSSNIDALLRILGLPPKQVDPYIQYLDTVLPNLSHLVTHGVHPSPLAVQYGK